MAKQPETLTELINKWRFAHRSYETMIKNTDDPEKRAALIHFQYQLAACIGELEAVLFKNPYKKSLMGLILNTLKEENANTE